MSKSKTNKVYWTVFNRETFFNTVAKGKQVNMKDESTGTFVYRDKKTGRFAANRFKIV